MVSRSTLAVSFVVVLVLLSGCSSLVGNNGNGGEGPTDPEEFDYAAGFSADGITDGQQALTSYNEGVQAAGNFTGEYEYVVTTSDGETEVGVSYQVDFDAEQALQQVDVESPSANATTESYYENGELYQRSSYNGEESGVSVRDQAFPPEELTASEAIRPLLTNASSYNVSIEERNGESVVVYETTAIGNSAGFLGVSDLENVTNFEASFVVDSDGVIHSASYQLSYIADTDNGTEERSVSMNFELSSVGDTTVERPDWPDEA
ncbi:MAG: hypothetical protein ACI8UR_001014 [Natronomonas sp.]|jgi:hypothetical protein|uniref:DUF7537 family lipoprotein n=1 Tax=Natronomonas sp. TaxID=2184060 RepID=UPI003988F6D6